MEAQPIPKRRGRAPVKAYDDETFLAVVRLRAELSEDRRFAGLRPPSVSQACKMVARDTGRSPAAGLVQGAKLEAGVERFLRELVHCWNIL